jgi:hypothetical protein
MSPESTPIAAIRRCTGVDLASGTGLTTGRDVEFPSGRDADLGTTDAG